MQAIAYKRLVIASGAVGYWPLDETSGSTAMQLGSASSSLTGTYSANALPGLLAFPAGGRAAYLTGTTSTISISDDAAWSAAGGSGLLTLEAWFHSPTNASSSPCLISKLNSGNYEYELGLRPSNQATAYSISANGSTVILNCAAAAATTYPSLGWSHAVYTYDRAAPLAQLFVNGRLATTSTTAPANMTDGTTAVYLGGRADSATSPLAGGLAHCAIYNKVLSTADIQAHYRAGLGCPPIRSTRLR